jgi:hypothetical protein
MKTVAGSFRKLSSAHINPDIITEQGILLIRK